MPWDRPETKSLQELKNKLEDLKVALKLKKVEELNKLEAVLNVYDIRLKEKLQDAINAGKVEQP